MLLIITFIAGVYTIHICIKPFAERHYRDAYFYKSQALQQKHLFPRYKFAIEEYESAISLFPWETQYSVMLARDMETFIKRIKNPILRVELIQKALDQYTVIQQVDNINPWYYTRVASLQNLLAYELKETDSDEARNCLIQSSENKKTSNRL